MQAIPERGARGALVACTIIACTVAIGATTPSSARADTCIPSFPTPWTALSRDGKRLLYCFPTNEGTECMDVDLVSGTWSDTARRLPDPSLEEGGDSCEDDLELTPGAVRISARTLKRCPAKGKCRTWRRPAGLAVGTLEPQTFALDDKRKRLVVTDTLGEELTVTSYDLGTGKRLARRTQAVGYDTSIDSVQIIDSAVVVAGADCDAPCAVASLFDVDTLAPKGPIGLGRYEARELRPVRLAPHTYAFLDASGHALSIHDVRTGRLLQRADALPTTGNSDFTARMTRRPQGDLLIWGQGGVLTLVDATAGTARVMRGPVCPD